VKIGRPPLIRISDLIIKGFSGRSQMLTLKVRPLALLRLHLSARRARRRGVLSQAALRHGPWRILGA